MMSRAFSKIWIVVIFVVLLAGGILTWEYFGVPKEEVKVPEEEVKDETANWKTYRDEEYEYEVKYPRDWKAEISLAGRLVNFYDPLSCEVGGKTPCSIDIAVRDNSNLLSSSEWADKYIGKAFIYSPKEPIVIGGIEGVKFTQGGLLHIYKGPTVILGKSDLIYEFVTGEISNLPIIFDQILSTFRFLE